MEACKFSALQIPNFQKIGWVVLTGTFSSPNQQVKLFTVFFGGYGARCALQPVDVFRTVPYCEGKQCYVCLKFFF